MKMTPAVARWHRLTTFIRTVIWSGFVKNGRPQSIMLVSDPGQGKSELLDRFRPNNFIEYYNDITMQQLLPVLKRAQDGRTKFLSIGEFQKIIGRRKSVSANFLSLLMMALEEGVHKIGYGPVERDFGGVRLGLLAATTRRSLIKNPYLVSDISIDSRMFFVDAHASLEEIRELEKRIADGDTQLIKPVVIDTPGDPVYVDFPKKLAQQCRHWTEEMRRARGVNVYGVRTLTRFMHLCKGVALSHGRDVIKSADLDEVYRFKDIWLKPPPMPSDES